MFVAKTKGIRKYIIKEKRDWDENTNVKTKTDVQNNKNIQKRLALISHLTTKMRSE